MQLSVFVTPKEFRFSQLLYHEGLTVVQKLTESKSGIPKFGIPIEIRSLMSAGIGCSKKTHF